MKKKALIVITKSNFGGAQRYVYDLVANLPPEDFETVVAFGPGQDGAPGRLAKLLAERGVRTAFIPQLIRDLNPLADFAAYRALLALFRAERPDVVHLNSSKAGGLGALAARHAGVPRILFTVHGLPSDERRGTLSRAAIAAATWLSMLLTHATIAVSSDTHERSRRYPLAGRKVSLIHNGIVTPNFFSRDEARGAIRTLAPDLPAGKPWIGMIGELHPNKDYATAIAMMEFLESDAHLVIMGDGELRGALANQAAAAELGGRVHFLGYVPDAARYARAFDAFLLTSRKEGLPYVLLEAGYAYLPVVASDAGGVRDIILQRFTGLLVPPGDPRAFSQAIETVLGDATLARDLAGELLKRVQKSFSLDAMIQKTAALYRA